MDTWPEEEAALTYQSYLNCLADENEEYANAWLFAQVSHMGKVFDDLIDTQRYLDELKRLMGN